MKLISLLGLLLLSAVPLHAQKSGSIQKKIELLYNQALIASQEGKSVQSADLLKQILKLDANYYLANFALADLHHEAKRVQEEIVELRNGLAKANNSYPVAYKFLAQALYETANYKEALQNIEHYLTIRKSSNETEKMLLASCRFSVEAVDHPTLFQPVNPGDSINSPNDEYWPSLNAEANELVFTRLLTCDQEGKPIRLPQEDFYVSKKDSTGWNLAKPIGPPINTPENEGAQTLSADGRLLIFTACGRGDGIGSCDLYISAFRNGKWTDPVNLGEPVNSTAWESQPSLSANGEVLFFVSNRKGGFGKMDIWKAIKTGVNKDGLPVFGNVSNVSELNTIGNDLSPFIHADGKSLYFASDSRPGLGGNDLYLSRLKNGEWTQPVNLGYPINTNLNEEGLSVEISGERAWYSSNRLSTRGKDIFYFTLPDTLRPERVSYLKGKIVDATTNESLSSDIKMITLSKGRIIKAISLAENQGEFLLCLPSGENYAINITREGYLFASEYFSLQNGYSRQNPKEITVRLQPIKEGISTILKNIFFETDSWALQNESQVQIGEMTLFMNNNPQLIMEVSGHTDNTGTTAHNLELSRKRAESVVQELVKNGVSLNRLKSRGAGSSSPVSGNETEEGRSANRRTEFKILGIIKK